MSSVLIIDKVATCSAMRADGYSEGVYNIKPVLLFFIGAISQVEHEKLAFEHVEEIHAFTRFMARDCADELGHTLPLDEYGGTLEEQAIAIAKEYASYMRINFLY